MLLFNCEFFLTAYFPKMKVYTCKTITLSVVLYGCETWYPILREEQRFKVFANKVLRKIFRAKRD